jgi:hypothetical protein
VCKDFHESLVELLSVPARSAFQPFLFVTQSSADLPEITSGSHQTLCIVLSPYAFRLTVAGNAPLCDTSL